jgi:hypothetical protein
MRVLFLGGCLFTTKTVERNERFIHVLAARNEGIKFDFTRYASYALVEEVFLTRFPAISPDLTILLIRPFPFYVLAKLIPRVSKPGGGTLAKIQPAFFSNKKQDWFKENDRLICEKDWNPNGTKRSWTHGINLHLGKLVNLDNWAIGYVKRKTFSVYELCRQKNSHFIVVGPPAVANNLSERKLLTRLNQALQYSVEKAKIPYVNLFAAEFPEALLGPDKVHYTKSGHFLLAQKIEEKIATLPVSIARR